MRRLLHFTFGLITLLTLACATLPWWLGLALPALVKSYGATFARYESTGYTRFALEDVSVRLPGVTINAARVDADTPVVWLVRRVFGQPGQVVIGPWRVTVINEPSRTTTVPTGWLPLRAQLRSVLTALHPWIPRAEFGPGVLAVSNREFKVLSAAWANSTLDLRRLTTGTFQIDATLDLFPQNQDLIRLTVVLDSSKFTTRLILASRAANIDGQLIFLDHPADLTATSAHSG